MPHKSEHLRESMQPLLIEKKKNNGSIICIFDYQRTFGTDPHRRLRKKLGFHVGVKRKVP